MVIQVSEPQEQFKMCDAHPARYDASCQSQFPLAVWSTRETDETMQPEKWFKLSNAAALLDGFVVKEVLLFTTEGFSLNKVLEMTLGFVKLNGVRYAAIYDKVAFVGW